jgi:hypothetical protein
MRPPKFDARLAIHTLRKIGVWNGEVVSVAVMAGAG